MNFYSDKNVYEAALDRFRYIFNEFKGRNIVISFSGGKDSTVILHLAHEVMSEFGIKKIPVFFCDQEVESPQTIDYIRKVMSYDWVEPYWIQSFFQEWNSSAGEWFNVWGEGEEWCREKEPSGTYTDIKYKKTRHFKEVLHSMLQYHFGDDYIAIGGVRMEESPTRRLALSQCKCYKDITWGKSYGPDGTKGLVLYPIWDWSFHDVWYYILKFKHDYCRLYNYLFTKHKLNSCRVSSFIHENSIQGLKDIKEIAPEFYVKALKRVKNINTTVQTLDMFTAYVNGLPAVFASWDEYIHYLCETIVANPTYAVRISRSYDSSVKKWRKIMGKDKEGVEYVNDAIGRAYARSIISEDFELSKVQNAAINLVLYKNQNYDRIRKSNQE